MPIFPCFDPTTGASGGAAPPAPGASLANVPMRSVDPTSWTETDPDGLLDTVSYSSGVTSFTMNAAAASADYTLGGTSHTFPRLSTTLTADAGDGSFTTCTTDDYLVIYWRLRQYSSPGFRARPFIAVCADALSSVPGTMQPFGVFGTQFLSDIGGGLWNLTSTEQNGNANFDALHGVGIFAPERGIQVDMFGVDASGIKLFQADRFINQSYAASQDLQLMVGVATENGSTAVNAGDVVQLAFQFQVFRLAF
jgi:hypothetical protein